MRTKSSAASAARMFQPKNIRAWSLPVALLLALSACSRAPTPPPEIIRPVVTVVVPEPEQGRRRAFSGVARAAMQTPLSFRVGGEMIELPVKRGQQVRAGELIARLDPRDHDLQLKQSEAQLAQTAAQLEQARSQYQRVRELYETRNISKSDLDAQAAAFKSAEAQHSAAQKSLELARQQLEYCTLNAPFAGAITDVPVENHQTVAAGQTIATLSSDTGMEIEVGIPESLIARIAVGDPAEVTFEAIPGARFEGRVSETGIEINNVSSYPVKVRLAAADPRIRMGMLGEATFVFKTNDGVEPVHIPAAAIVPMPDGRRHVWVYDAGTQTVQRREVTIGALTSAGIEITGGLQPGERVVTRGVNRVEAGMRVKLMEQAQ